MLIRWRDRKALWGYLCKKKNALTREVSKRYQHADKKEKTRILDELVKITELNRKYLSHKLARWGKTTTVFLLGETVRLTASPRKRKKGGGRKPVYTEEFTAVLRAVWAFFWYRCGKILAPFMRAQMQHLKSEFRITPEVMELLLKASPATIDRKLKKDKKKLALKGKSRTRPGSLLKKQIPVRTYYADADKNPGFFEVDTVHHCGIRESGEFCLTLSATDVYSGWVELRPLLNKAEKWILQALPDIKSSLPFPFLGLDSDNGSEFINKPLLKWCSLQSIQFTRSRPYHKNDNCFVEQKNNSCVRNFVGYGRFSSAQERDALGRVYRPLCLLLNYFMPTQKLLSKTRAGSKIKKVYDKNVLSPYQRLLSSPNLSDGAKGELTRRYGLYNPVELQREVHHAVDALMSLNKAEELESVESLAVSALQAI
jgi:hypothetical protein